MKGDKLFLLLCMIGLLLSTAGCISHKFSDEHAPQHYKKVLAVSPSIEEIVIDLLEPDQLVAVSDYARDPQTSFVSEKAKRVRGVVSSHPSTEEIMALHPDYIVLPVLFNKSQAAVLRDAGFSVLGLELPEGYEEIKSRILHVSQELHAEEAGNRMIEQMDQRMEKLRNRVSIIKEKKVVVGYSPLGAFGRKGGAFDHICHEAGAINGAGMLNLQRGEHLSKEQIVSLNPDVILCSLALDQSDNFVQEILHDPAFSEIKAVKNKQVFVINDRYISSVTQHFVTAAEKVAELVYLELFET